MRPLLITATCLLLAITAIYGFQKRRKPKISDFDRQKLAMKNPERVVLITDKEKHYDVPPAVNAFFACSDINTIYDKTDPVGDAVLYSQEPWTGSVQIDGQKFDCKRIWDGSNRANLGTIEPGQTKTVTVPLKEKP